MTFDQVHYATYSGDVQGRLMEAGYRIKFDIASTDQRYVHIQHDSKTILLSPGEDGLTKSGEVRETRVRQILTELDFLVTALSGIDYKNLHNDDMSDRPVRRMKMRSAYVAEPSLTLA